MGKLKVTQFVGLRDTSEKIDHRWTNTIG